MKQNCRIIILTAAALTVWACSNSHESNQTQETASDTSFHKKAKIVKVNGGTPEEYIALQKKAVEEMRQGKAKEPSVEILAQMGFFYFRSGDYLQALTYLQEAADSMRNTPQDKLDIKAGAELLGTTSNLYGQIGLYDEALEMSNRALELCTKGDNTRISDLWRMRSVIYEKINQLDSAMLCNKKSIETSDDLTDKRFALACKWSNSNSYAGFFIEHPDYAPDSIAMAVDMLKRNYAIGSVKPNPTMLMLIGRGTFLLGNTDKGIKMMEEAVRISRQKYGTDDIEWALSMYSQSLVENELSAQSLKTYREAKRMTDTVMESRRADALLGADFKYRTSQIKNEKIQLANLLKQKQETDIYKALLALTVITIIIFFTITKIRRKNKIISDNKEAIDRLIKERIALNTEIEKLNNDSKNEHKDNNDKLEAVVEDSNSEEYLQLLTMQLLKKEDDSRFRQLFDSIFPGYIQKIRRDYAGITPTSELICMLIKLNKSNEEISLALGIKRESVAKTRYRLRSLFKLDKETDLNEFLAKI